MPRGLFPHQIALRNAALLHPRQRAAYLDPCTEAFDALRAGRAGEEAWSLIAETVHVAEELANAGIVSDRKAVFAWALGALGAIWRRVQATSCWTLRGPEIAALQEAIDFHRIQLEHCTQGELFQASRRYGERMRQARAGNAPRGMDVIETRKGRNSAQESPGGGPTGAGQPAAAGPVGGAQP